MNDRVSLLVNQTLRFLAKKYVLYGVTTKMYFVKFLATTSMSWFLNYSRTNQP